MARLFYAFVAIGIVLVIALAAIYPLPENQRFRSEIAVIPDGGRQESFTIHWPGDRVQPATAGATGLVVAGKVTLLGAADGPGASAEIFRLRDAAGNVIGLASRSTSIRPARAGGTVHGSDWMLLVPSRGSVFMTQHDSRDVAPRLTAIGATPVPAADDVTFWAGETQLVITAGPAGAGAGEVLGGTGEFGSLRGAYDETWELDGITPDGAMHGRITLVTRMQAAP